MSISYFALALVAQDAEGAFSMHRLLQSLPTDPASIITLLIAAAAVGLVIWTGRSRRGGGGAS